MTDEQHVEEDRVIGRRVEHATAASEADERAYAAADPDPGQDADTEPAGPGGESERAARDLATDAGSEPTRSE